MLKFSKNSLVTPLVCIGFLAGCQSVAKNNVGTNKQLVFEGHTVKEICDAAMEGKQNFGNYIQSEPMSASNIRRALQQRNHPSGSCAAYYKEQRLQGPARGQAICDRMMDTSSLTELQRKRQMDACMNLLGWE